MQINLDKVTFINDFFSTMLPDGSMLVLNKVDEDLVAEGAECIIKSVNIEIQDTQGNVITCPCVIGLGNDLMQITTNHKEYEGAVLSPDNMVYCTIEVYE